MCAQDPELVDWCAYRCGRVRGLDTDTVHLDTVRIKIRCTCPQTTSTHMCPHTTSTNMCPHTTSTNMCPDTTSTNMCPHTTSTNMCPHTAIGVRVGVEDCG